jgi:hypothetical protein
LGIFHVTSHFTLLDKTNLKALLKSATKAILTHIKVHQEFLFFKIFIFSFYEIKSQGRMLRNVIKQKDIISIYSVNAS